MAGSAPEPEDFAIFLREIATAVRELTSEVRNDRGELFEGMRAQRAALVAILDRFRGGGAEAGA